MTIEVKVVLDSVSPDGIRLTTMSLRYPKFIHGEAKTHRVLSLGNEGGYVVLEQEVGLMDDRNFSRNASSSRAVPTAKLIEEVRLAMAMRRDNPSPQPTEATHVADDGTIRKSHYGEKGKRQPWDDFIAWGWAAKFAAACVVRYLRRTKPDPDDMFDACWYYTRLHELCATEREAEAALAKLDVELTGEERRRIELQLAKGKV
jgi:hypothetical protein